jgi:uncharacterized protein
VAPAALDATVHKDKNRFRLVGTLRTALELGCSRCLETFQLPVNASFDVRYLPQSENTGEEREVEEDDLSDAFYKDEQIDLGQLMEEQFYLALPMKPLCREDCQGLCPVCGGNRNVTRCACEPHAPDPRWAALKGWAERTR